MDNKYRVKNDQAYGQPSGPHGIHMGYFSYNMGYIPTKKVGQIAQGIFKFSDVSPWGPNEVVRYIKKTERFSMVYTLASPYLTIRKMYLKYLKFYGIRN